MRVAALRKNDWELSKKNDERRFIRETFYCCLGFTIDECDSDTRERKEEPDLYVTIRSQTERFRIGCEVTRVLVKDSKRGSKTRSFRAFWQQLFDDIEKEEKRPLPPALVSLRDSSSKSPRHKIKEELKAAGALLEEELEIELESDDVRFPNLAKSLSWILLKEHQQDLRWWPIHLKSGPIADLTSEIEASYLQKCKRGLNFSWEPCDGKLLLLVAEGLGLDDIATMNQPLSLSHDVECPFDWVWVFNRFSGNVWQIYPDLQEMSKGIGRKQNKVYRDRVPCALRKFVLAD